MAAMRYAQTASLKEAQGRYGASGMLIHSVITEGIKVG